MGGLGWSYWRCARRCQINGWSKPHPARWRGFMPPPLQDAPASAVGEGWGGGSDICRYTKSGLKYRPFTYTNPAILYVNCRQCCPGGGAAPPYRFCGRSWSAAGAATVAETRTATPLPRRAKPAAGEGWGGGSDICRYTKSGLKYRPFTYTNPAILYVNCRPCCLGGGASPTLQVLRAKLVGSRHCNRRRNPHRSAPSPAGHASVRSGGGLGWG